MKRSGDNARIQYVDVAHQFAIASDGEVVGAAFDAFAVGEQDRQALLQAQDPRLGDNVAGAVATQGFTRLASLCV